MCSKYPVWHYGYDGDGNQTTVTEPLLHVTTDSYDSRNRLTQVKDYLQEPKGDADSSLKRGRVTSIYRDCHPLFWRQLAATGTQWHRRTVNKR